MEVRERRQVVKPILAKELPSVEVFTSERFLGDKKQYGKFVNISNVKFDTKNVINLDSYSFTSWFSFENWLNDNFDIGFKLNLYLKNGQLSFNPTHEQIGVVFVTKDDVIDFFGAGERVTSTKIAEIRIRLYAELKNINKMLAS